MNRTWKVILIVLFLFMKSTSSASENLWGEKGQVVASEDYSMSHISITNNDGGVIVVRKGRGTRDGCLSLCAQRLDRYGQKVWGGEKVIQANIELRYQIFLSFDACTANDGGVFVTWDTDENDLGDVYAARLGSNGGHLWLNRVCDQSGRQRVPKVVSDGAQGAIVIWGDNYIHGQYIDEYGNRLWGDEGKLLISENPEQLPEIASGNGEGVYIAWNVPEGYGYKLYVQKFDQLGMPVWDKKRVSEFDSQQVNYKIIPDSQNGVIIAWEDYRNGEARIFAQKIIRDGSLAWGNVGVAAGNTLTTQEYVDLARFDEQNVVLTWFLRGHSGFPIYCQRLNQNGEKLWGEEGSLVAIDYSNYSYPKVASDQSGQVYITWQSWSLGSVFCQKLNSNGIPVWQISEVDKENAYSPQIVNSEIDNVIVTWKWNNPVDYDDYEIRGQRYGSELGVIIEKLDEKKIIAYPNPAEDEMKFMFSAEEDGEIKVVIFNMLGERITQIKKYVNKTPAVVINWDCRGVSNGIYIVVVKIDDRVVGMKKIAIL